MNTSLADYFSKDGIGLRSATDKDIATLVPLINDAYAYQNEAKGEPRTNARHLRQRMTETDFYVITHNNKIVGCVYVEPKDAALHLGLLTLTPEYRGKGIAQRVMAAVDAYAKANNFESIELDYMSLAPWLKTYYETHGFVETGQVVEWGKINLIRMSKRR
jgi:N-acetylglutamate synthase-like GNAT family acetyltransferase